MKLSQPREITPTESAVILRMLDSQPSELGESLRASVTQLRVVAVCDCGCDTVEFEGCDWSNPPRVVADARGVMPNGNQVGVIVFADGTAIRSLEVYSLDGETPRLPLLESLSGDGGRPG